jgi:hypothetical protein
MLVALVLSAVRNSPVPAFRAAHPGRHHFMFLYDRRRVWQSETRQKKNARVEAPSRALDNRHRALAGRPSHALTNAADHSTRCQANLSSGFQWSLRRACYSRQDYFSGEGTPCAAVIHRGVFLLRPDAVAIYLCVCTTECAPSG